MERSILEIAETLRGFQAGGSNAAAGQSKAAYNSSFAIEQLRSEIDAIRERIFAQSTPKIGRYDPLEGCFQVCFLLEIAVKLFLCDRIKLINISKPSKNFL